MENDKTFDVNKISPCPNPTLWLFSIAMENGPFIDGLPILNNQRVTGLSYSSTTGFSHGASQGASQNTASGSCGFEALAGTTCSKPGIMVNV
jgi:hypothetical protein